MIKTLILLTVTCISSLFGSNPFPALIDETWEVFPERFYVGDHYSWRAKRSSHELGYYESLEYSLTPWDDSDFGSLEEWLNLFFWVSAGTGYELVIHSYSESVLHLSWTGRDGDWIESGTTLFRSVEDYCESASYAFTGKGLEEFPTSNLTSKWISLFAQEVETSLLADPVSVQ